MAENKPRIGVHIFIYLIWISVFFLTISSSFLTRSISLEGLSNSNSVRTDEGFDSFWTSIVENSGNNADLPLGYLMEKWAMNTFGDGALFEKVYSLVLFVLCCILLIRVWRLCGNSRVTGWIPMGILMIVPIVTRTATQNVLELPLTMFILMALCCLVRGYFLRRKSDNLYDDHTEASKKYLKRSFVTSAFAGFWLSLAFMTKGFLGCYLLVFPLVVWIYTRKEKIWKPIVDMLIMLGVWAVIGALMWVFVPNSHELTSNYIQNYFNNFGQIATVSSRFWILWVLFKQLVLPIILFCVICVIYFRRNNVIRYLFFWKNRETLTESQLRNSVLSWGFFTLGFLGVLPILLSRNQQDYFIIPMIPMFVLGFACMLYNICIPAINGMGKKVSRYLQVSAIVLAMLAVVVNLNSINRAGDDSEILSDVDAMIGLLNMGDTVSVTGEVLQNEKIAAYLIRYKHITLDTSLSHQYLISSHDGTLKYLKGGENYERMQINTQHYHLYAVKPVMDSINLLTIDVEESPADSTERIDSLPTKE
ncbi:MAG: phospholipid carrier-dependent glycosyltransferase [Bacteroidales bacterium]|nr:phospholipid carrier-dependent glycosyltransferase [Bacteroidales bacterium]